jgi:hypothetical protein
MTPLGCLCQFQSENLDAVLKDPLLNWLNMQRVDMVVYLEQRPPDVVQGVMGDSWIDHRSTPM